MNILLDIPGAATKVYLRPLKVWGSGIVYKGLTGTTTEGRQFWILYDCGNPVVDLGSTPDPAAKTTPAPPTISPTAPPATPPPTTPSPVQPTLAPTPPPQSPTPSAAYSCDLLKAYLDPANPTRTPPFKVTFDVESTVTNTQRQGFQFDFGDGVRTFTDRLPITHTYVNTGEWLAQVSVRTIKGSTPPTPLCKQTITTTGADLTYHKSAVNLSVTDDQGQPTQAAGTTVQGGQQIRYTLTAKNNGLGRQTGFTFREDISDILEYADLSDARGGKRVDTELPNQTSAQIHSLAWSPVDIEPGQVVSQDFVVTIKSPVPTTPRGVSNPGSYDLKLENIFHDTRVVINLASPTIKQAESVSQSLPVTGGAATTFGLALFASGAVFIFLRQRLIMKELEIISLSRERS